MSPGSNDRLAVAGAAADAARSSSGVVDLHGGAVGEFATYGPGGRVRGVRVALGDPTTVTIRVVAAFGQPLGELGEEVRRRVGDALARVDAALVEAVIAVHVADVRLPETERPELATTPEGTE